MGAIDEFFVLLENTEVMKLVMKSLREEPALILGDICREYEKSSQPVPDHRLRSVGYMGEASIKALISAGLIKRQSGGLLSLYAYEPTPEGLKQWEKLKGDGFYKR